MLTPRKLVVPLVLTLTLLIMVPSSSIASSDPTSTKIVRGIVTWTLPSNQCPDINADITGTGRRLQVTATTRKQDGSTEIIDNDFVTGTARDTNGRTYSFVYTNQARQLVPPSGSPIRVIMTDSFDLREKNGDDNLNVGFVWNWTYSPPDEPFFPPIHHWNKVLTYGDPFLCDPI